MRNGKISPKSIIFIGGYRYEIGKEICFTIKFQSFRRPTLIFQKLYKLFENNNYNQTTSQELKRCIDN